MFDGKTIIVTGASGGIGVPLVSRLIDLGARVIAIDVNPHGAEILVPVISDASRLVYHCSGIEDEAACHAILGQEEHLYGLVHLAGIFVPDDMASGDVETVYDPVMAANIRNLYALYATVRHALLNETGARVVLVSSLAFRRGAPGHTAYSAAKGALVGMASSLARKEAPHVLVNVVAPGFIDTTMPQQIFAKRGIDKVLGEIPMKRLGTADEVASVIQFLLGPESAYVTG
ncbi:MAG TPA: hypothetical protein DEP10_02800, partial [Alphaproteobacteria bacterium]|nr:hypothetical protein [Alphaproteobacteria bacterium]